jgi:hypothetical protein
MANAGIAAIAEAESHAASRHGSPRCARPRSSHAGIESVTKRQQRFRIPARLDSDAGRGRRDPWRSAIPAISAFEFGFFVDIVPCPVRIFVV